MKRLLCVVTLVFSFVLPGAVLAAGKVSPLTVDGATSIDVSKAKALFEKGVVFVDVRSDKDWNAGRIPDAIHLELKKIFNEGSLGKEVKKDQEVVIYCNGPKCLRSSKATAQAVAWGYSKVYYYREGFPAWKAAGNPVE